MVHKSTVAAAGFLCQPFFQNCHWLLKFTAEQRKAHLSAGMQELPRGKKMVAK